MQEHVRVEDRDGAGCRASAFETQFQVIAQGFECSDLPRDLRVDEGNGAGALLGVS
jgi:hypothetical protein